MLDIHDSFPADGQPPEESPEQLPNPEGSIPSLPQATTYEDQVAAEADWQGVVPVGNVDVTASDETDDGELEQPKSPAPQPLPEQPEEEMPLLQAGGGGSEAGDPPGRITGGEGSDGEDDGPNEGRPGQEIIGKIPPAERVPAEAVEQVAAFMLTRVIGQSGDDQPADSEVTEEFVTTMRDIIAPDGEPRSCSWQCTVAGELQVKTTIAYGGDAEELRASSMDPTAVTGAEVEVSMLDSVRQDDDNWYPPQPFVTYKLVQSGEQLEKTVTRQDTEVKAAPSSEEVRELIDVAAQTVLHADSSTSDVLSYNELLDLQGFEARMRFWQADQQGDSVGPTPSREVLDTAARALMRHNPECVLTSDGESTDYTGDDLERFIKSHPGIIKNTRSITSTIDPARPDYWINATEVDGVRFIRTPEDVEASAQYLDDVRENYRKLAELGATVPPTTRFLVRDKDTHKSLLFEASQDTGNGRTLWTGKGGIVDPELAHHHERAAEITLEYLISRIEEPTYLQEIAFDGYWGEDGVLYHPMPFVVYDLPSLESEFGVLRSWLERLPPTPKVLELQERTQLRLDWFGESFD